MIEEWFLLHYEQVMDAIGLIIGGGMYLFFIWAASKERLDEWPGGDE